MSNEEKIKLTESIEPLKLFFSKMMVGPELKIRNNCLVTISGGKIVDIVPESSTGDSTVKYQDHLAVPGFINSHLHSGDSVVKDRAYGLSLNETVGKNGLKQTWLRENIQKLHNAILNTIIELQNSSVTAALEMREGGPAGIIPAINARNQTGYDFKIFGRPDTGLEDVKEIIDIADGFGLNATTVYTDEQLIELSKTAKLRKKPVIIHCMETVEETDLSRRIFGETDLYRAVHLLKADFIVHAVHASEKDLKLMTADDSGVKGLICCPRSNAYFGGKFPPVDWFLNNYPEKICLGTDNMMTTSPSVLEELKWTALNLLHRKKTFDCRTLLKMVTTNPSQLFNLKTGIINVNFRADFNIIDLRSSSMRFSDDLHRAVVFRSNIANYNNIRKRTDQT